MKYVSTRSAERKVDAAQAIVAGLSHEGGLYVPEEFPAIGADRIEKMANLPYAARAKEILGAYLTDYTEEELQQCVDGAYAPERFGGASLQPVVRLCYSGKYTEKEMTDFIRGKGGLVAYLGTADAREVEKRIADGDAHAKLVYDGMLYSCARAIGGLAAAADGRVDRIILTGGLAHSHYVTGYLTQKLSFIAPVEVMAGEFELEALAAGASRVLNGQEQPRRFADIPQA